LATSPVLALRFDGAGGAAPVELDELVAKAAPRHGGRAEAAGFYWIHLDRNDADAAAWLREQSRLDEEIVDALLAEDTRPRCTAHDEGVLIFLRGVNLQAGAELEDMVSIRLWCEQARVVSVWLRPLHAIDDLMSAVDRRVGPSTPGDFIARLAERIADRIEPTVTALEEEIDALEDAMLQAQTPPHRSALAELRRRAIRLHRYVGPQRDALTTLQIEDFNGFADRDRTRVREAAERTTRLLEELQAVRERAAVLYDELMDLRAERSNRYMLWLSVVAAVFLPLSLLTGLLGMNLAGIPGAQSPYAFGAVTAGIVAIGISEFWLFRRLGLI
jgi:zinc transporter